VEELPVIHPESCQWVLVIGARPSVTRLNGVLATTWPRQELDKLVDDFLATSGIVFGIRDYRSLVLHFLIGEQSKILHYMAKHTGGQYSSAPPSGYAAALEAVLMQLHFRDFNKWRIPPPPKRLGRNGATHSFESIKQSSPTERARNIFRKRKRWSLDHRIATYSNSQVKKPAKK